MQSILYSFIAGVSTVLGAIIVFYIGKPSQKTLSGLLGFAGGIMIAISSFDLMPEALEFGSLPLAIFGFVIGAFMMYILDKLIPHAHLEFDKGETKYISEGTSSNISINIKENELLRTGYLVFLGIAMHNLPEGLAIGAGLESSPQLGASIALAIALHNIPEGVAVAGPLTSGGLKWKKVFWLTLLAGLFTPVGAALGLIVFNISSAFISIGLAFAAGAMIYIVSDELMPTSHSYHSHLANAGLIAGFLIGFIIAG